MAMIPHRGEGATDGTSEALNTRTCKLVESGIGDHSITHATLIMT